MFFVGLDLGQRKDFTAVAVVEREMGRPHIAVARATLLVRHLERMALGTAYTRVVERVCGMMRHPALERDARLVVDATGVGAPVVELLRGAGLAGRITAVTITPRLAGTGAMAGSMTIWSSQWGLRAGGRGPRGGAGSGRRGCRGFEEGM